MPSTSVSPVSSISSLRSNSPGSRIAVVGSGISGLSAAWLLSATHRVTLFEKNAYLGGHTHTVDVTLDGITHPVDTGFLVFNRNTYPNLCELFAILGVQSNASQMSFSVQVGAHALEWAGSGLASVFAQKRNLLRPTFWTMLRDIARFNRDASAQILAGTVPEVSLDDYLAGGHYSNAFRDWYLLPMAGTIWSCPTAQMLQFPAASLLRFMHNHGLLTARQQPQWHSVAGGARQYVERMRSAIHEVRCNTPVIGAQRFADGVRMRTDDGALHEFDCAVFACHSDQTLRLIEDADADEKRILGAIKYRGNRAALHTDASFLPRRVRLWSAWNYHVEAAHAAPEPISVSYLIGKLQPLPFKRPVIVTLNPTRPPRDGTLLRELEYEHPVFDQAALAAQAELHTIQGKRKYWFSGAWTRYGFHEDGLLSGLHVARALGVSAPWIEAA
jgi:uncharacterized protein